jgi:hypothetical protein
MSAIHWFIIGFAALWVLSVIVVAYLAHKAPHGREIPGVGFVFDKPQDDGHKYVNGVHDNGKQVEKWRQRYEDITSVR